MLLVPRQLRRVGMTGDVPYYGGRFTPAQAYAASHPRPRPAAPPPPARADQLAALQHLLDTGVITSEEHRRLLAPSGAMSGPVQVLVVGFEEPSLSGEILAELTRLGEAGVVRLLDVLLVTRTEDGRLETLPAPPGADPDLGRLAAAFLGQVENDEGRTGTDGTDPTAWSLDDTVSPGGASAIAFIEHTWAQPLVDAIRRGGGRCSTRRGWPRTTLELLGRLAHEVR